MTLVHYNMVYDSIIEIYGNDTITLMWYDGRKTIIIFL